MDTSDLTAAAEKLGRGTEQLTAEAQERARELRQRVGSSFEDLQAGQHVREVGDQLKHQLDDTIKPAVHQAAPSLGKGLFAAISALASLPLFLVRALGRLASTAQSVPERSAELRDRAQHLVQDNPLARRQRRQQRRQLVVWSGAAFGVGVGLGWFLGRRSSNEMIYDPPLPVPAVAPTAPSASAPLGGVARTLPEDPLEAAAAAEEVLEEQLDAAVGAEALLDEQLEQAVEAEAEGDGPTGDGTDQGTDDHGTDSAGEHTDRPSPEA